MIYKYRFLLQAVIPKKRQRKPTQRFGDIEANEDHYFESNGDASLSSSPSSSSTPFTSISSSIEAPSNDSTKENSSKTIGSEKSTSFGISEDQNDHYNAETSFKVNDSQVEITNDRESQICKEQNGHSDNAETSFKVNDSQKANTNGLEGQICKKQNGLSNNAETSFDVNDSKKKTTNSLERQVCRIEAKINQMQSTLSQLHRTIISSAVGVNAVPGPEQFPELPLDTEESMNKFETDLNEKSYRKKVVSVSIERVYFLNLLNQNSDNFFFHDLYGFDFVN